MPMLYVIQKGFNGVPVTTAENIAYCVTSIAQIINHKIEFVFTNGHAIDRLTEFYTPDSIQEIETLVDFSAVKSKYWNDPNDLDLKRRKEAEFLISGDIPASAIVGYIVNDLVVKNQLLSWGVENNKVYVQPNSYF